MKLVLSSNSPRRKELLAGLGVPFEIRVVPDIDESYPLSLPVHEIAQYIAKKKAAFYDISSDEILITADTIVVVDNIILGKPGNDSEACQMLAALSGKTHLVITGVCIMSLERQRSFSVTTEVTFKDLSQEEIDFYIQHYHPFDKAGSYGIQEWIGYIGVTSIKGSYFNVMGLPIQRIYEELTNVFKLNVLCPRKKGKDNNAKDTPVQDKDAL
jgi:septum formation protein